jgi:2-keto-3-deoxy-L-fuconate dehydrogenase
MNSFNLKEKTAIVTGGGSGIGKAIAHMFARHGANVILFDVSEANLQALQKEWQAENIFPETHVCNVSLQADVDQQVKQIVSSHSRIDILVNSAGIAHVGNLESTTESDFNKLFEVNVKGVYHCMRAVVPVMKQQKKGVILNIASVAAFVGISDRFAYSMTKGAVVSMTLSVAKDYVNEGIRCNSISPGRVHTPFVDGFLKANYPGREKEMFEKLSKTQPIGRMAQPEEIAHLALYLCSDEAAFITGTDYPIDGGFLKLNT